MGILTRTGAGATFANFRADIETAFVAAGWDQQVIGNHAANDQFSFGYPTGAPTQYSCWFFDSGLPRMSCLPAWGRDAVDEGGAPGGAFFDFQPINPDQSQGTLESENWVRGDAMATNMVNTWVFYDEPVVGVQSYVHAVAETSAGVFVHLAVGFLNKYGTYSGGQYSTGTRAVLSPANTIGTIALPFMRPSGVAGITGTNTRGQNYLTLDTPPLTALANFVQGRTGRSGQAETFSPTKFLRHDIWELGPRFNNSFTTGGDDLISPLISGGLDKLTGITLLHPIYCTAQASGGNIRPLLGDVPDVRYCSMAGFQGVSSVTIGADTWRIFPMHIQGSIERTTISETNGSQAENTGDIYENTGQLGLAYREIP